MTMIIPQRILVAPSGFKGSMEADEVAAAIAAGIHRVLPGAVVRTLPVPDGGEGTARLLAKATGGKLVSTEVTGPLGEKIDSHFALLGGAHRGVALVEMAAAAGLSLIPRHRHNPGLTSTYGVGELMVEAASQPGVHTLVVGCGDSGTSDGGAGALAGLGARILDSRGRQLPAGGIHLGQAATIDLSGVDPRVRGTRIILALNEHNVLCGPRGVARVFGPQKGATAEQVEELDRALTRWARLLTETRLSIDPKSTIRFDDGPGTGASGGLGAGLALLGAELTPRFEALVDSGLTGSDLSQEIGHADLVVTAEGAIDGQTPHGKVPAEIARRAQAEGTPVLALAGSIGDSAHRVHDVGIGAFASIIPLPMRLEEAVENGAQLLTDSTERTFRILLLGSAVSASLLESQNGAPPSHIPALR